MSAPTAQELRDWSRVPVPRSAAALPLALVRAWNKAHPERPYRDRRAGPGDWPDKWRDVRAHSP